MDRRDWSILGWLGGTNRISAAVISAAMLLVAITLTGCPGGNSSKTNSTGQNSNGSEASSGQNSAASKAELDDQPKTPLRIVVVDDPALAESIEGQWQAVAEQTIRLKSLTAEQLESTSKTLDADVIIFPHEELGTLVERRQIVPVPDDVWNSSRWNRRDLLELPRQRESSWGQSVYALPLGSRQLMLWYRRDLFEKLSLSVPRTWSEYQTVAQQLADRELVKQKLGAGVLPDDSPWAGTLEPVGGDFGGSLLAVRAAAYLRHRSQYSTFLDFSSLDPLLNTPPFQRALDELLVAVSYTHLTLPTKA